MSKLKTLITRHGTLYRHDDTDIIIEANDIWVTITILDNRDALLIDKNEWPAFVKMIKTIDKQLNEQK